MFKVALVPFLVSSCCSCYLIERKLVEVEQKSKIVEERLDWLESNRMLQLSTPDDSGVINED